MGFWDSYEENDTSGLSFVSKEEKAVLIKNAVAFPVQGVREHNGKFGAKYLILTVLPGSDEQRAITFARTPENPSSRDRLFESIAEYLETDGAEPPVVVIQQEGQFQKVVNAETADA